MVTMIMMAKSNDYYGDDNGDDDNDDYMMVVTMTMMMMPMMMIMAGQKVSIPVCVCIRRVEAVLRIYRFHHQAGTTGVALVHLCRNDISPNIWSVIFHHQVGTTCVFGVILRYILVVIFHQLLVVIFHHKAGTPVHLV